MTAENQEELNQAQNANENIAPAVEADALTKDYVSELRAALWSVISFERCEATGLSYAAAERKIAELEANGVSGLCIVTAETADRVGGRPI